MTTTTPQAPEGLAPLDVTGDLALALTNEFTGATFRFSADSADEGGVGGDLMHSSGNIWLHVNDVYAGSLWVHRDSEGEIVVEFGNACRESESWEPQATFPLSQINTESAPVPTPPGYSDWTPEGKAALARVLEEAGQDMAAVSWNSEGVAMIVAETSVIRVVGNGDVAELAGSAWQPRGATQG